jgi:hypothetical protein
LVSLAGGTITSRACGTLPARQMSTVCFAQFFTTTLHLVYIESVLQINPLECSMRTATVWCKYLAELDSPSSGRVLRMNRSKLRWSQLPAAHNGEAAQSRRELPRQRDAIQHAWWQLTASRPCEHTSCLRGALCVYRFSDGWRAVQLHRRTGILPARALRAPFRHDE